MGGPATSRGGVSPSALRDRARRELALPAPRAARRLADVLADRFGDATQAVLFYGSCLRRQSAEGVLDFYVLVDDYRAASGRRALAFWNRVLPPNVLYVEHDDDALGRLRAKVAVLSVSDFERAVRDDWPEVRVWARFAQPARLVRVRDDETRSRIAAAVAQSLRTLVAHVPAWFADEHGVARIDAQHFWYGALRETYGAEFRSESDDSVRSLFAADPERYRDALAEALGELAACDRFDVARDGPGFAVRVPADAARTARHDWARARRRSRRTAALGLAKCVFTFEGWVDYGLWKLERHRGAPIAISERQKRHPLLLGWPVLLRLLRERTLR